MSRRRLDAVVRVRTLREQLARGEVSRRHGALEDRRRAESDAWAAIRDADRDPTLDARVFIGRRGMLAAGAREAEVAAEATVNARTELHHAAEHWQQTARRLDGIERLVDRLTDEVRADEQRRTANELDDLVVMRWTAGGTGVER